MRQHLESVGSMQQSESEEIPHPRRKSITTIGVQPTTGSLQRDGILITVTGEMHPDVRSAVLRRVIQYIAPHLHGVRGQIMSIELSSYTESDCA